MIHGVDISSFQPDYTPGPNEDFVFIKATEGTSYRNLSRRQQIARARRAGVVVGHYHFLHHGNIGAQVTFFLASSDIADGDLLVCDWEASGCDNADKDEFIRAVQAAMPGCKVGLYCSTSWWKTRDTSGFCGDFLWIAAYGVASPGILHPYAFWQYTSKPIDQNHGYFASRAALKAWANGSSLPTPAVTTAVPIVPGAVHTAYGQWGPSWSWNRETTGPHKGQGQHGGEDWHNGGGMAEIGKVIRCIVPGRVIYAGRGGGWGPAFGNHVLVESDQRLAGEPVQRTTVYAHMDRLPDVHYGQQVAVGDRLGVLGMSGNVSGPHLHLEQHLGQGWGDRRVKPHYAITLSPAVIVPQGVLGMTNSLTLRATGDVRLPKGQWKTLPADDHGHVSILAGELDAVLTADLALSGLAQGHQISAQFYCDDWRTGSVIRNTWVGPKVEIHGSAGFSGGQVSFVGHIGKAKPGYSRRLKLRVLAFDAGVTVTTTTIRALHS